MTETPLISTRYQLLDKIGSGGMGVVYSAYDRLLRKRIALKKVSQARRPGLQLTRHFRLQLSQEFKVLSALRHPHIVQVQDYGFDVDGLPYFTMELLNDASTIIQAAHNQPLDVKINLIWQGLLALEYLHRHNILHRDLKPHNILVTNNTVKLLDFGLAVAAGESAETAGTLAYMAPEILQHKPLTERSDLYSFAVIMYEILGDQPLYSGLNMAQIMSRILGTMPDIAALNIPPALAGVLERALSKEPLKRYDSAASLLAAINEGLSIPLPLETAEQRESYFRNSRFVGRVQELNLLLGGLTHAQQGEGSAWMVAGESGVGKSRLVAEVRTRALVEGFIVLQGQAVRERGRPFQMWEEPLRWLCFLINITDEEAPLLRLLIPDLEEVVGRPIGQLIAVSARSTQERLFAAIISVITRAAMPILLILEDIQWAGKESQQLLGRLSNGLANTSILLVTTFRDEQSLFPSQALRNLRLIRLQRFNRAEIADLTQSMLDSADPRLIDYLDHHTEGNIFFLQEVLNTLVELSGDTMHITPETLPDTILTEGIESIARYRISLLPPGNVPLLEVAAVIGRDIDLALLKRIAPQEDLELWLSDCAFTVLDQHEGAWRFAHDKIRESLLHHLETQPKRQLHERVANAIVAEHGERDEVLPALVHHWHESHQYMREAETAIRAAAAAERAFAYDNALNYQQQALSAFDQMPLAQRPMKRYLEVLVDMARLTTVAAVPHERVLLLDAAHMEIMKTSDQLLPDEKVLLIHFYEYMTRIGYQSARYALALTYADCMTTLAEELNRPLDAQRAAGMKGRVWMLQGHFAQAVDILEATRTAYTIQRDRLMAECYLALCYGMLGQTDKAFPIFARAIEVGVNQGVMLVHLAGRLLRLWLYSYTDQLQVALVEAGIVSPHVNSLNDILLGELYHLLHGWLLLRSGNVSEAQSHYIAYQEALARKVDGVMFGDWLAGLTVWMPMRAGDLDVAQLKAEQAVGFAQHNNSPYGEAVARRLLAEVLYERKQPSAALFELEQSSNLFTACQTPRDIVYNERLKTTWMRSSGRDDKK